MITLAALHVYPVKSCRGIELASAKLTVGGLAHDREWMIVDDTGRFLTQRVVPRMALIDTALTDCALILRAPDAGAVSIALDHRGDSIETVIWRDRCRGIDQGEDAAAWVSQFLGRHARLVRFHSAQVRHSDREWTGDAVAQTRYADGFALLAISRASLEDLNGRLPEPVPMDRFRPNLVLDGLPPYGEDELQEFGAGEVRLRAVKPCTRCVITTTDQAVGAATGPEPLRTLKTYRWNEQLRGATFGQNVIVLSGTGADLRRGQQLQECR